MKYSTRRARALRREAPSAEKWIWSRLRNRRLGGYKFVRQLPIGPFFADFACRECLLIIEIDGATHSTPAELDRDARRSAFLRQAGYQLMRFTNEAVFDNLDGVMETILARLEGRDHV